MRRVFVLVFIVSISFATMAQVNNPVSWSFSAKKIADKTYEVHLTATIEKGWHIYSPGTPDGGPVPTTITFSKSPLLVINGTPREVGKLEQKHEPLFGVDVKQYSNKVDFVQIVIVKGAVNTAVKGSVEFMVCNDSQCLPPSSADFSVPLK